MFSVCLCRLFGIMRTIDQACGRACSGAEESEDVSSEEESVVESEDAEGSDYEEEESEGQCGGVVLPAGSSG